MWAWIPAWVSCLVKEEVKWDFKLKSSPDFKVPRLGSSNANACHCFQRIPHSWKPVIAFSSLQHLVLQTVLLLSLCDYPCPAPPRECWGLNSNPPYPFFSSWYVPRLVCFLPLQSRCQFTPCLNMVGFWGTATPLVTLVLPCALLIAVHRSGVTGGLFLIIFVPSKEMHADLRDAIRRISQ